MSDNRPGTEAQGDNSPGIVPSARAAQPGLPGANAVLGRRGVRLRFLAPLLAAIVSLSACSTEVLVEAVEGEGQRIRFNMGSPAIESVMPHSIVTLLPHSPREPNDRLKFAVRIQNDGSSEIDISSKNVSAIVNDKVAHVVTAAEAKASARRSARWAMVAAALAAGANGASAGMQQDETARKVQELENNRKNDELFEQIASSETASLADATSLLQLTTLRPGESVDAILRIEGPKCKVGCAASLRVAVGAEVHEFRFEMRPE